MVRGLRWIKTASHCWQLEDGVKRHFVAQITTYGNDDWRWHTRFGGTRGIQGECASKAEAVAAVTSRVVPIFFYCKATTFGSHDFAVFEWQDGIPTVVAVGDSRKCERYTKDGGFIVAVKWLTGRKT